jgi:hypothetical protein
MINNYPLPANTHESYNRWNKCESNKFIPDESQQFLMNIVSEALTAGLFYNRDVDKFVIEKIKDLLPEDYKSRGFNEVQGRVIGYEIYHARNAVEAITAWKEETEVRQRLEIEPGRFIGNVRFNGMTVYKLTIASVTDNYSTQFPHCITCMGNRGGKEIRLNTSAVAIENALTAYQERHKKTA